MKTPGRQNEILSIGIKHRTLSNLLLHLRLLCGAGGYPPNVLQPFETYCTNPALVSPFHHQKRSTLTGVRDLYQQKLELWARNVRSNLAIELRIP
jgi:hypothetical protein